MDWNYIPLGVTLIFDIEFALSKSVPKFDSSVTWTRHNLSVVSTEADAEDIRGVSNESASGKTSVQVPKTKGVVPGRGESELTVRGDDNVGNEVVVTV